MTEHTAFGVQDLLLCPLASLLRLHCWLTPHLHNLLALDFLGERTLTPSLSPPPPEGSHQPRGFSTPSMRRTPEPKSPTPGSYVPSEAKEGQPTPPTTPGSPLQAASSANAGFSPRRRRMRAWDSLVFDFPLSLTAQNPPVTQPCSFIFKRPQLWTPHAQLCHQPLLG